jgi:hypothetical protein
MENPTHTQDYTRSFTATKTPGEAYAAILRVPEWWIGEVEGAFAEEGAEFVYAYEPFHRTVQRVKTLVPGSRVEWEVLESRIRFVEDEEEWKGTVIRFDVSPAADGTTEVRFTHAGLTPRIACYANCSAGWDHYIANSLKTFIETGKGVAPPF